MKNTWILFKREMMAYFFSPIAYIVGICALLVMGINFSFAVNMLLEGRGEYSPMAIFFNIFFTWIILLAVVPVLTMRLFSDEKKTGTIEALMTTPVRDIEYVFAKFLSGYFFFVIIWVPTFNYVFALRYFTKDITALDMGPILGGYIDIFLVGMLFTAMGCMASASTRNQIIAAVLAFALIFGLFLFGILYYFNLADQYREFFETFCVYQHMMEFSRGLIEWKRIVFYLTGTAFFLFITHRMVQSRQWKS